MHRFVFMLTNTIYLVLGKIVLKRSLDNKDESAKKRIPEAYLNSAETDSADSLVNGISQLTIQQVCVLFFLFEFHFFL